MTSIRLARESDAREIQRIYAPAISSSAVSFELEVPTEAQVAERIRAVLLSAPWLVYEENGEVLGYVYASKHKERAAYQWSVDVAVYVREDQHRRGIGRALYTSLFVALKLQGFYAAHAGITLPNAGSVGLHESLGFRKIGVYPAVGYKLGAWHDVGWWQLALKERVGRPAPPRSMSELLADRGWESTLRAGSPARRCSG